MYVVVYCKDVIDGEEVRCVVKNALSVNYFHNSKVTVRTKDNEDKCGNDEARRLDVSPRKFQGFMFDDVLEIKVEED